MATALLIVHGLVAFALLGAISHQTLATWAPAHARPGSFFGRFRAVPSASFANAIVVLWICWRQPRGDEPARTRVAVTSVLAFIVWWGFLIGHVMNNIRGFGA